MVSPNREENCVRKIASPLPDAHESQKQLETPAVSLQFGQTSDALPRQTVAVVQDLAPNASPMPDQNLLLHPD